MLICVYHRVSAHYLKRYIDEEAFRWNTRENTEGERFAAMMLRAMRTVRYGDVLARQAASL